MLRFLVGLILLLFTATSPIGGLSRGEPLNNLLENYDRLIRPPPPTEEEKEHDRLEEEGRRREAQREGQNYQALERAVAEQRAYLAQLGPTFEVIYIGGQLDGWHLKAACLIGETGNVYTYDLEKGPSGQAVTVVDQVAFSKAASLARSIGHVKWRPGHWITHVGWVVWQMSFDGRTTLLQVVGEYAGAHPDPRAAELVKLTSDGCSYSPQIRSQLQMWQNVMGALNPQQPASSQGHQ